MGLINIQTDLKSLKFGRDRRGGGSSNQPYIQTPIPEGENEVGRTGGPDFLLRGGTLNPTRVTRDASRLTQMFFDLKSPNGILFTAKQNVLSLTNVNTTKGYTDRLPAQQTTGINFNPLEFNLRDFVNANISLNQGIYTPLSTIAQAAGGIGLHTNKQGLNPLKDTLNPSSFRNLPLELPTYLETTLNNRSRMFTYLSKLSSNDPILFEYGGGPGAILGIGKTQIKRSTFSRTNSTPTTWNYEDILRLKPDTEIGDTLAKEDFRQNLPSAPTSLGYISGSIEQRVSLGNPADPTRERKNYVNNNNKALDKITALPLYRSNTHKTDLADGSTVNDLVSFRIGVLNNKRPSEKTYIHFRAFLDSFSDNYSSDWAGEKMMGRGENFYRYQGFDRNINLSWTVAAQSKQELIPMYRKLNYLSSVTTPDYTGIGYMGGNLITLTVGGYLYEQVGIIRSFTYDIPSESPWEIALGEEVGTVDSSVNELPHIIKVTGFQFTPIHNFIPKVQGNDFDSRGELTGHGVERYIALNRSEDLKLSNYISPQRTATVEAGNVEQG